MTLQKTPRFGLPLLRGTTPKSDDESRDTDNYPPKKLTKRSLPTQDDDAPLEKPYVSRYFQGLHIPQVAHPKAIAVGDVRIKHHSPWDSLTWRFSLVFNDSIMIASKKDNVLVAVKKFSDPEADRKFHMLQNIQHKNFVKFLDCFRFEESLYVVLEHEISENEKIPINLTQFALLTPYPTEQELATILIQILDGLEYLTSIGLEHGSLTCKKIFISTRGCIKIASQECSREFLSRRDSTSDIRRVGFVTMELMHKEARYDGPITIRDVDRWPLDSQTVQFLLMTESASSINQLIKHPLFNYERRELDLKWKVYLAEISVHRGWEYKV